MFQSGRRQTSQVWFVFDDMLIACLVVVQRRKQDIRAFHRRASKMKPMRHFLAFRKRIREALAEAKYAFCYWFVAAAAFGATTGRGFDCVRHDCRDCAVASRLSGK